MCLNLSILLMSPNISTDLKGANEKINCTMDDVQDYFIDHCVLNDILERADFYHFKTACHISPFYSS